MTHRALRLASTFLLTVPACYRGTDTDASADTERPTTVSDGDGSDNDSDSSDDESDGDGSSADGDDDPVEPPAPFDASDPESYTRKVKQLLIGEAVLPTELAMVKADPDSLRDLVRDWTETEAFRLKMLDFFTVSFQQEAVTRPTLVSQLRGSDAMGNFFPNAKLFDNITESFSRTAWALVEQGKPFNEVASTRTWMMTTAMMSFLAAADDPPKSGPEHIFYHEDNRPDGVPANASAAQQAANRAWSVPNPENGDNNCATFVNSDGEVRRNKTNNRSLMLPALMGNLRVYGCDDFKNEAVMRESDFSDWREVTLTTLGPDDPKVSYYDIPALRNASALGLEVARTGFFSTPAFLAKWRSNVDNSYRVITNQSLIVALGQSIDSEDTTTPLDDSGLSDDHADPTTSCYGCHAILDPMRNFFMREYDPDFYTALDEKPDVQPSFAFFGVTAEGEDLADFGRTIADHPKFAVAWVQKLCYQANSQRCYTADPEFERIVEHFVQSGYDFRELVVELYSSPLVTGAERTKTHDKIEFVVSITRRAHLCQTLGTRLQIDGVCSGGDNAANAIPEDAWSRGSATPFQPASSSLFYAASIDSFCSKLSRQVVDAEGSSLQSSDMNASVTFLVETLMDLSVEDSRHDIALAAIEQHIEEAREVTGNDRTLLESAFTLACTSPFVSSVGY